MSDYLQKKEIEFLKEKYKISLQLKEYERAKEYYLKIKELEDGELE